MSEGIELNLGPCHYGPDDHAVLIAKKPDQVGWIPVCEAHRDRASEEGYEVFKPDEALVEDPRVPDR